MEEAKWQEEYKVKMEDIRKTRESYQEQLAIKKKAEEEFSIHFYNDMRELEAIKDASLDNSILLDKTENCQNTLQGMKRKIDDMFETMQKELLGKIKELDDKEGYLRYETSQMKGEDK